MRNDTVVIKLTWSANGSSGYPWKWKINSSRESWMNDVQEKKASRLQIILKAPSFHQPQRQGRWISFTRARTLLQSACFPGLCLHPKPLHSRFSCFNKGVSLEPKNRHSWNFFPSLSQTSPWSWTPGMTGVQRTANVRTKARRYHRDFHLFSCQVLQWSFKCRFAWKITRIFFPFPRESSEVNDYATMKRAVPMLAPWCFSLLGLISRLRSICRWD